MTGKSPMRAEHFKRRTPTPIDLRALQAFVAVCESGSMTCREAARPEPERGPNVTGRALVELAGPLIEHAQMVRARIGDASHTGKMPVRLGCVDSFAATLPRFHDSCSFFHKQQIKL
ncbi:MULTISPECIES: hypothetical protein [unclassified Paraburkholderia]|uniref:hypothetical protein n=1 Tax=unclassified Paraburkholderia TaxID=2615204 RepID=UPI0017D7CCEA|nr:MULTISPECIES: hypothetical protein [unclassified Paraburkholderia]MBB5502551.1 DNA-binding transcriptional LysR family regulator [Paraburkholderia sp. MM5384-R2]